MRKVKRKNIIIGFAIFAIIISGILMINKSSYAYLPIGGDSCARELRMLTGDKEEVYVKDANNRIDLPYGRFYTDVIPESSFLSSYRMFVGNAHIFDKYYENYYGDEHFSYRSPDYFRKSYLSSYLMNYLVNDTYFSDDENEDDYYKQLLVLWAIDRVAGFSDDINYIYDYDVDDIVEAPVDTQYDDKYEIDRYDYDEDDYHTYYYWKYANNLSAGDKKLLKKSKYGDKMLEYLDTWEDYVTWYVDQNHKVELDSLTQSGISYHVTNDYVETGLITPTSTGKVYSDKFSGYTVDVESPMVVVNQNGEEETSFDAGESFRVRIPISEIKNKTLDYSIHINGEFEFDSLAVYAIQYASRYEYPSQGRMMLYEVLSQSAFNRNCVVTETLDANLNLEFSQKIGNLNVKVIDSSTGKNLSRAEVTIYDLKGNEVYQYETTDSELNITLPVGEYIVKQTVTPPNYEAQTVQMRVDVTESGEANAVLENAPLVNVPDTAMNSIIFIIIGGLIVIAGGLLLFTNLRKKESH